MKSCTSLLGFPFGYYLYFIQWEGSHIDSRVERISDFERCWEWQVFHGGWGRRGFNRKGKRNTWIFRRRQLMWGHWFRKWNFFVSHTFCRTPLLPPEGITFVFFLMNNFITNTRAFRSSMEPPQSFHSPPEESMDHRLLSLDQKSKVHPQRMWHP